jgi:hypothetical protein
MRLETAPIELIKHWILDARSWILDIGYLRLAIMTSNQHQHPATSIQYPVTSNP